MIPLNHMQIETIRNQKRDLEVNVAKALNRYFQQHYKYSIQRLTRRLLFHILSIEKGKLNSTLADKQGAFLLFARGVDPSWYGLNEFLKRELFWTLENCSDIIRLFGEINEKWKNLGLQSLHEKGQLGLRPEPTFVKVGSGKPVKEGGWGKDFGHRHRSEIGEDQRVSRREPYANIGPIVRGVEKFKFEPKSVIGAIDRTFGLRPEGGDVSGTTTDSIYALNWAGGVAGVSQDAISAVQLLPLVTMVPQGHHTTVECAYPLSRHGYINYHIGYYTTLAPINAPNRFDNVLASFDGPGKNKHILVWGRGAGEQGVQMNGQEEINAFKKIARVLSAYGFCVTGGLRDFGEALNIMKTFSPNLLAPRLQELQPQVGLSELERKFRQFGLPRR